MTFTVRGGVARPARYAKLDVLASHGWYAEHLAPVWNALPEKHRGVFYVTEAALPTARALGLKVSLSVIQRGASPVLVAASGDMFVAHRVGRTVAMMEHGAGQSYGGDRHSARHSSYAGGDSRFADLFLHPGPNPAARDAARYPDARVEVVGCPKLDDLPERDHSLDKNDLPSVAVSFHWDCQVTQETRSSFIYFRSGLRAFRHFNLLGHGHPRMMARLRPWYERKGIEVVSSFSDVLKRADLYVTDNSSSLFEFAATGRPVAVFNPPFYRRSMNHGLRFWEASGVGPHVGAPEEFGGVVRRALEDPVSQRLAREAALDLVYTPRTGAAQRAADVLVDWMVTR